MEGSLSADSTASEDAMMKGDEPMMGNNEYMMKDGVMMDVEGNVKTNTDIGTAGVSANVEAQTSLKLSGTLLAGASVPLVAFTKVDYDAAVNAGKLVVLYFYANWCPICKAEFPVVVSVFNELKNDAVVGFLVNYNDDETDADEKALARQFGVAYQHTKVFVKGGTQVLKSPETWAKVRYQSEIKAALEN